MSLTIRDITTAFAPVKIIGDPDCPVSSMNTLDANNSNPAVLCWCNSKNVQQLRFVKAGTIIIPEGIDESDLQTTCNYIMVENPRQYFNNVLTKFFWNDSFKSSISNKASISESAELGHNVFIADNVVIHDNCTIGDNVRVFNNTIIYPNTVIENNVIIGANNVIGNYGFGYEKDSEGHHILMPHIGNVVIGSNVEIGNNNCIDRSVLGSTVVKKHTKIHNFVQVAHGVQIGENCLITANVTISGGTHIGDCVWIGPGATISNKLKIGNSSYVAIGCVVLSDVPDGSTVSGNPGRIIKTTHP